MKGYFGNVMLELQGDMLEAKILFERSYKLVFGGPTLFKDAKLYENTCEVC